MTLLSIDCSSFRIALACFKDNELEGTITIDADRKSSLDSRVYQLFKGLKNFIDEFQPDNVAIERAVYFQNFNSSKAILEVIAMCKLVCNEKNIPYTMVHNTSWKRVAVGKGNATKDEIRASLCRRFPQLETLTQDEVDAVGIGLYFLSEKIGLNLEEFNTKVSEI